MTALQKELQQQRVLVDALFIWHGGQTSGVYAVASCMYSDLDRGQIYHPRNHHKHVTWALPNAIRELRNLKEDANFPEAVTPKDEAECNALADQLQQVLDKANA